MKRSHTPRKISTLIILYFSLFMVAILVSMSAISYYYSYENMKERTIADTKVVLSQVGKNIGRYIGNAKDITGIINANTDILDTLQEDKFYNDTQKLFARRSYERFLKDIPKIGDGIVSVFIFGKDNIPIYVPDGLVMKPDYDITQEEWFKKIEDDATGMCAVTGTNVRIMTKTYNPWVISLSRRMIDEDGVVVGTQLLELNYGVIDSILSDINLGSKGYVFIVDSDGKMIYHPQLQLIYSGLKSEDINAVLKASSSTIDVPEQNKMYTISTVPGTGFSIVGVTFLDELVATASEMNVIYIILALLMVLLAFIGSVQLAKLITKPLDKLELAVNEVEKGNLDADFHIRGTTEVEKLGTSLNSMTNTVKQLLEQIMEDQERIRTSELKALQSQINPHFLYNTLDSIIWIAEDAENEKIKEITMALANYFRIVLSSGEEIITVAEEVEHVRSYLIIQKMRYENLDFEINVDAEVLKLYMPKLLLQPVVENAIYHGIKNNAGGGKILVKGFKEKETLIFEIIDNGRGMRPFELENSFADVERRRVRHGGVGLNNIRERISLYYGEQYGVKIESEFKKGTCVTIMLPVKEER